MSYTMYTPLNVWLDPASVTDVVAYIQTYLRDNPIYSEEEIEEQIHDYLIAHPELIGGVQSVNGKTGTVVLSASDINTENNVTIESVLASLSSQISTIAANVATNTANITSLTGRVSTAETDLSNLKSSVDATNPIIVWRNGSSYNPSNTTGIAFTNVLPTLGATSIKISVSIPLETGYKYRYQISTYNVNTGVTQWNSNRIVADRNYDVEQTIFEYSLSPDEIGFSLALYLRDTNNTNVPLRIDTFDTKSITILRSFDVSALPHSDYVIDSNFIKTNLVGTNYLGQITGTQGFCKYNNYYYSSSGSGKLYKQDSSFAAVSNADLNLGHCNSLQLGHNGHAYASGWDDQNVYDIDLETMTISQTIALPTTGYTTVAVDDLAQIMYIFQRDTTPGGSVESYNFITYDYNNNQVVSTRKTPIAFGAQQGLDFVNGRIFVTFGLGTSTIPNGFVVFDTSGNVLSEYVLNSISSDEPQGIFIDRTTYQMFIKISGTSLREILFY